MKVRWLAMVLTANSGGWAGLVTVLGRADSKALAFYRKAVDGRLTTLTPHTEEFKSTVTSDGIKNFEGVVEGRLLSPCELEPEDDVAFIQNQFASGTGAGWGAWKADWKNECRKRLHSKESDKEMKGDGKLSDSNPWVGVMLGIIAKPKQFLCHADECRNDGKTKQASLEDNSWNKTWNYGFKSASELKKNYKLDNRFFNSVFYQLHSGARKNWNCSGFESNESENCKSFQSMEKFAEQLKVKCGSETREKRECKDWFDSLSDKRYIYIIDKEKSENQQFTKDNWWLEDRGGGEKWKDIWNNQGAFWWWFGASPDGNEDQDSTLEETLRPVWIEAHESITGCAPVPRMLREGWAGSRLELTIESFLWLKNSFKQINFFYILLKDSHIYAGFSQKTVTFL